MKLKRVSEMPTEAKYIWVQKQLATMNAFRMRSFDTGMLRWLEACGRRSYGGLLIARQELRQYMVTVIFNEETQNAEQEGFLI